MIPFLLMLLAVGVAAELYSLRHALDGVEYDLRFSKPVAEPDEPLQLITVVTNRRRRFLPFLRVRQNVPSALATEKPLYIENYTEDRRQLQNTLYLMPRQRLTRRATVSLPARGCWRFEDALLFGGDFLGLGERATLYPIRRELVVLPRAASDVPVDRLLGGYLGETSVNRFILEDPILTLGFREYTGREPMKQIAWAQTARMGQLMVRRQDFTVERTATVVFNVDTFLFGSYAEGLVETCCALARSVCEALEARRIPYAFLSNAACESRPEGFGQAGDGLGVAHLRGILEGLGRVNYEHWETLDTLLAQASAKAALGRLHIFITPSARELDHPGLARLRQVSGQPALAFAADSWRPAEGETPVDAGREGRS